jgi:16S rRNA (cytidine1402-2'-O)-methyltransferase
MPTLKPDTPSPAHPPFPAKAEKTAQRPSLSDMTKKGMLYIVSTPIGNLEDITLRALRILKEVDVIAAEDTRHTRILLDRYGISKKLISFHSYSRARKTETIVSLLEKGTNVALVSDAGTPGISDPGCTLIRQALDSGIPLTSVPGPTALIAALVISGKPTNKFVFEGFLSNKSSKRRSRLTLLKAEERTIVLYESCHRIQKLLGDMSETMGDREVVVVRELTKKFEEIQRGPARSLAEHYAKTRPRGEFIVVV